MRGHSLTAVLVAALLLVVAVAAATGAVAAQVDTENEDKICEGTDGNSLVLVLADGTYVRASDTVTLLPDTEADVALCSDGQVDPTGSAWELQGSIDGISITSTDESSYTIVVEDVTSEEDVNLGSAVSGPSGVTAPEITASPGKVTTVRVDGKAYPIVFSGDQRQRFTDANESYVTNLTRMNSTAERLKESAGREELSKTEISAMRNTTEDLNRTAGRVQAQYPSVQSLLFGSATGGNAAATNALNAYQQRHRGTVVDTANHLQSARAELQRETSKDARTVLGNLIGVLVVGFIAGAVGGRTATNYVLEQVEGKRRRSSAYDFRLRQLLPQFGIALLFVAAAVGVAVVRELAEPLVAAVLAVIGL